MNTVLFVNRPLLSNQARMRLYVGLIVCARTWHVRKGLTALAWWQRKWNAFWYVLHMFVGDWGAWGGGRLGGGGVMNDSRTLPNILPLYICSNVWWHLKA